MRRTMTRLLAMTVMVMALTSATPAFAVTAHRYWSDGSGGQSSWFLTNEEAYDWINDYAKGYGEVAGGYSIDWIMLRDNVTSHHASYYWRGYGYSYYNQWDPLEKSLDIQYTIRYMGYSLTADNYYGPTTAGVIRSFQANNGLYQDGITGAGTYEQLSWDNH